MVMGCRWREHSVGVDVLVQHHSEYEENKDGLKRMC